MINIHPTVCNICGGDVVFTSNSVIYGREYGSGKCYLCTSCGAYVGTHKPRPREALGILADSEMREMKKKCHEIFDSIWQCESTRKRKHLKRRALYKQLSDLMGIPEENCHFGYFDAEQLSHAYQVVSIIKEDQNGRKEGYGYICEVCGKVKKPKRQVI